MFYIELAYEDETMKAIGDTHLFKLNTTSMMWEDMEDLKYTVFFIKLCTREVSIISRQKIASEFGGYVHILYDIDMVIYAYLVCVNLMGS